MDRHRDKLINSLVPVESYVRLAEHTVLGSREEHRARVTVTEQATEEFNADLNLVIWSMPGMHMVIGPPGITARFRDKWYK